MNNVVFVLFAICVHFIFLSAIFEIYFTSPLVHGMRPIRPSGKRRAPASRLVLFVGDGLRSDKCFDYSEFSGWRAPFLRQVALERGAWGISHTRVPTESRPGHVALIAGFYEDVSAVAKGWKENPVEFDSVFNESVVTWSWGSPDILPIFSKDVNHVRTVMYPAENEDFAGDDSSRLDTWVFNKVEELLSEARKNRSLRAELKQEGVVFFLHLLGIDTNGHGHNPASKEYLENIRIVDDGVKRMEALFEEFYSDKRTAYVFTSDHGMTNWGSHGAGDPHETLTPLVVWGSGVRPPRYLDVTTDLSAQDWNLTGVDKRDVNQADLAPLMSALAGLPLPMNSVGKLPVDLLSVDAHQKAELMRDNALQILAQLEIKMQSKKETTLSVFFRPFQKLLPTTVIELKRTIQSQIRYKLYENSIEVSRHLIDLALEGLQYYHTYDRIYLEASITAGFIAWILYVLSLSLSDHRSSTPVSHVLSVALVLAALSAATLLWAQSLPWTHYIYVLLPLFILHLLSTRLTGIQRAWKNCGSIPFLVCSGLVVLSGIEMMVASFFYRQFVSLGVLMMTLLGVVTLDLSRLDKRTSVTLLICLCVLAIFPFLPVVGRKVNYSLVYLVIVLAIFFGSLAVGYICSIETSSRKKRTIQFIISFQFALLVVAGLVTYFTQRSLSAKRGLPVICQLTSWSLTVVCWIPPLIAPAHVGVRLLSLSLAALTPYTLLSTSHEGLFVLTLIAVLVLWIVVERLEHDPDKPLAQLWNESCTDSGPPTHSFPTIAACRTAYCFLFLILCAFFGTGNIASINSFEAASVYNYLTVFSPFTMAALMLLKIVIPFLLVAMYCCVLQLHVLRASFWLLSMLSLLLADVMALHFFFLVQDTGSWLQIGTSISHYVIAMSVVIVTRALLAAARFFTSFNIRLVFR